MNALLVFLIFLAVRITSVLIVKTFYVPDEYWQSLEVAHKIAFGYGYLTWEWKYGIRSYIYPAIFAGIYKILALFHLDTVELLVTIPRIFQALLSAYADYRFYVWTGRKKWAIFLIAVSYFWFYTATRTLVNTLETDLTAIGLSYFPWEGESTFFIWIAAFCCYLRPTSAVIWATLCLFHLRKTKLNIWDLLIKRYLIIGTIVLIFGFAVDSFFYGKYIFTPWEFLKFNVIRNVGTYYGTHPWYWYVSTLFMILGLHTLPFLYGIIDTIRHWEVFPVRVVLLTAVSIYLLVFTFLQHKEQRFLLILMPMCSYICSDVLSRWSQKASRIKVWLIAVLLFIGNVAAAWYISTVHQKGSLEVMPYLTKLAQEYRDERNQRANFLFLMPCHSTPFYSHIHENITMRFLTCNPNLENKPDYIDEADQFYESPHTWLRRNLPSYPLVALPSHLIMFDSLKDKITEFLIYYNHLYTIAHTEFLMNERVGKNILVYQRRELRPRHWEGFEEDIPQADIEAT